MSPKFAESIGGDRAIARQTLVFEGVLLMNPVAYVHSEYIHKRRVRVLSDHLADVIPHHARVLDVGCGDGLLAYWVMQKRPDVRVKGIDVLLRPQAQLEVELFDGQEIPYGSASFDVVMFIDVLHHATDPIGLLREARRVARQAIVVKDHTRTGLLAGPTLWLMDWIGNARHGVRPPAGYWSREEWLQAFVDLGGTIAVWRDNLQLYPWPVKWICERSFHFLARLDVRAALLIESAAGEPGGHKNRSGAAD